MTWKPEVNVDNQWSQNALVFDTEDEARAYAQDLYSRWMLATGYRAVESDLPANYTYTDRNLVAKENNHG